MATLFAVLLGVSAIILPQPASIRGASVSASVPYAVTTARLGRYVSVTATF